MKTLFSRIKPEFLEKIVDDRFPVIVERLIIELKIESYIYDLRLEDANQLFKYVYGIYEKFNLLKLHNIFNKIES